MKKKSLPAIRLTIVKYVSDIILYIAQKHSLEPFYLAKK